MLAGDKPGQNRAPCTDNGGRTAGMMPDMANDVRIEQLWIPDSLEGPDAADFIAAVEVGRKVRMQTWGSDDLAYAPQEKLLELADPYERQVILVARVDGEIVGTADIALPLADNLDLAEFTLDILPEYQGQGVGRQLLEAAEHFARDEGRRTILIDTNHPGSSLPDAANTLWLPSNCEPMVWCAPYTAWALRSRSDETSLASQTTTKRLVPHSQATSGRLAA